MHCFLSPLRLPKQQQQQQEELHQHQHIDADYSEERRGESYKDPTRAQLPVLSSELVWSWSFRQRSIPVDKENREPQYQQQQQQQKQQQQQQQQQQQEEEDGVRFTSDFYCSLSGLGPHTGQGHRALAAVAAARWLLTLCLLPKKQNPRRLLAAVGCMYTGEEGPPSRASKLSSFPRGPLGSLLLHAASTACMIEGFAALLGFAAFVGAQAQGGLGASFPPQQVTSFAAVAAAIAAAIAADAAVAAVAAGGLLSGLMQAPLLGGPPLDGAPPLSLFGAPPAAAGLPQDAPPPGGHLLRQAAEAAQRLASGFPPPLGGPLQDRLMGAPLEGPQEEGEADEMEERPLGGGPLISTRPMSFALEDGSFEDDMPQFAAVAAPSAAAAAAAAEGEAPATRRSWGTRSWQGPPGSGENAETLQQHEAAAAAAAAAGAAGQPRDCSLLGAASAEEALSCQVEQLAAELTPSEARAARRALLAAAAAFPKAAQAHIAAAQRTMQQAVSQWRTSSESMMQRQSAAAAAAAEAQFDSVSFMARAVHQAQQRMQGLRAAVQADSSSSSRGDSYTRTAATTAAAATTTEGWWEKTGLPLSRADMHRRVCAIYGQQLPRSLDEVLQALRVSLQPQQQQQQQEQQRRWGPKGVREEEIESRVLGALLLALRGGDFARPPKPWAQQLREQLVVAQRQQQLQQLRLQQQAGAELGGLQETGEVGLFMSATTSPTEALLESLVARRRLSDTSQRGVSFGGPPLGPWLPQLQPQVVRGAEAFDVFVAASRDALVFSSAAYGLLKALSRAAEELSQYTAAAAAAAAAAAEFSLRQLQQQGGKPGREGEPFIATASQLAAQEELSDLIGRRPALLAEALEVYGWWQNGEETLAAAAAAGGDKRSTDTETAAETAAAAFLPPRAGEGMTEAVLARLLPGERAAAAALLAKATQRQQHWAFIAVSVHPEKLEEAAAAEAAGDSLQQQQLQVARGLLQLLEDEAAGRLPAVAVYGELAVRDTRGDIVFGPAELLCPHATVPFRLIRQQQQQQHQARRLAALNEEGPPHHQGWHQLPPAAIAAAAAAATPAETSEEPPLPAAVFLSAYLGAPSGAPWEPLAFEVSLKAADGAPLADDELRPLVFRTYAKGPIHHLQQQQQHQQYEELLLQQAAVTPTAALQNAKIVLGPDMPKTQEGEINHECLGSPYVLLLRVAGPLTSSTAAAAGGHDAAAAAAESKEAELSYLAALLANTLKVSPKTVQLCAITHDRRRVAFRVRSLAFEDPVIGAATWRRALLNPGAPIHKVLRIDLTQPPAITRQQQHPHQQQQQQHLHHHQQQQQQEQQQQQQDVLTEFFALGDGPKGLVKDNRGSAAAAAVVAAEQQEEKAHEPHKAAAWVWLLVGVGAILTVAVAAVTAVLAYQVLQQRREAKAEAAAEAELAAAAAAEDRISTASHGAPIDDPTPHHHTEQGPLGPPQVPSHPPISTL
ncbi:hypothetical protein Emed_005650 [Eimeria media]